MSSVAPLGVERDGDTVRITMNRPERRNTLTAEHLVELRNAFAEAGRSDATGIVLGAKGTVFCAGHDFADVAARELTGVRELLELCTELMRTIQSVARATRGSRASKALGKQTLYAQLDRPETDAYSVALEVMASASQLPGAKEGMAAFLEKRDPVWPD